MRRETDETGDEENARGDPPWVPDADPLARHLRQRDGGRVFAEGDTGSPSVRDH